MPFWEGEKVLLHYDLRGPSGAPVLALANSLGTDSRIWDGVVERLAGRYRVLTYDQRGHGLSDAPAADYSLDDLIDDLEGLLDHLGILRLALGGVSVGGLIAQGFALRHRQRLAGLVLCDTAPKIGDNASWNGRIAAVRANGIASISTAILERWFTPDYRAGDQYRGWKNMLERCPVDGYAGTCAALRDADLTQAIGNITMPVLVVVGEADLSTPVALVKAMAERLPDARFQIIPGAGHIPSIEQPEALAALVAKYLGEVGHG